MSRKGRRCDEMRERLALLLAGEIEPADRRAVEGHLESCALCRREAEETGRALRALAGGEEVPDPGPAYWSSFNHRLRARIRMDARARRRGLLAAAAGLLLAAGLGVTAHRVLGNRAGGTPAPAAAGGGGAADAEARLDRLLRRAATHEEGLGAAQVALDELLPREDGIEDGEPL